MKNLKIGTKLALGFGFLVALIISMAALGVYQLQQIQRQVDVIVKKEFLKLNSAFDALQAIQDINGASSRIVMLEDPEAQKAERAKIDGCRKQYRAAVKTLDELETTPEGKATISQMKGAIKEAAKVNNQALDLAMQGKQPEARKTLIVQSQLNQAVMRSLNSIQRYEKNQVDLRYQEGVQRYQSARNWLIVTLLIAIALGSLSAVMAARSITSPLKDMIAMLSDIARGEGDLTARLKEHSRDELGELARWFNIFVETVHDTVTGVSKGGIDVVVGSNLVHGKAEAITTDADLLVSRAASIATASEEMSATSTEIAASCVRAAEGGREASSAAAEGAVIVREAVSGMNRIAERVRSVAATVETLGVRSNEIGEIVGTIEDIADQTNLLALNAAIEAARAGEQGRGFAVVADEVRALAVRTTKATSEIGAMIRSIQTETSAAVASMSAGVREVEEGSQQAERSGAALDLIMEQINDVTVQISQIATAAEEQTATTNEIAGNIQQVTSIARETAECSHDTITTSHGLTEGARKFMGLLGKFKVNEDLSLSINKGKAAHLLFVGNIKAHLEGNAKVDSASLPTHLTCAFGTWVQGAGRGLCGHSSRFQRIEVPHAKVHDLGRLAVEASNRGDRVKADALCGEMTAASEELITILGELERECAAA